MEFILVVRQKNYSAKGYPYKRGVKLSFSKDCTSELEVEAGGG